MIPVVFIHQGHNNYLDVAIKKASSFNEKIVVISDHHYDHFVDMKKFMNDCDDFRKMYVHMSTNHYEYELFCIQRWIVLRNYMIQSKIETCFYLDSDVLLYKNVNEDYKNYKQYILSMIYGTCAVVSYISLEAINMFCDYFINIYKNKTQYTFKELEAFYKARQVCGLGGGVCDMTLLKKFAYQFPNAIGEMTYNIDNEVYDHCFNQKDFFYEYENGFKKLKFENGIPYCLNEKTGNYIQFKSLHFQGNSKELMVNYD